MPRSKKSSRFFPMERACNVCGVVKPLDGYHKDKKAPDGHRYTCKDCGRVKGKEYRKARKQRHEESSYLKTAGEKCCHKCKKVKEFSAYSKNRSSKDGYSHWCKECSNEYYRGWQLRLREKYARECAEAEKEKAGNTLELKKCFKCSELKDLSEYYVDRNGKVSTYCKVCVREYMKAHNKKKRQEKRAVKAEEDLDSDNTGKIKKFWGKICSFVKEGLFTSELVPE